MGVLLSRKHSQREIHPIIIDENICIKCRCFNRIENRSLCEQCSQQYLNSSYSSNSTCQFCKTKQNCIHTKQTSLIKVFQLI